MDIYKYKIFKKDSGWAVYRAKDWKRDTQLFYSISITDCYTWIKLKEEGIIGD